jgi:A/G-specific adenine glycosylase
VRLLPGIGRYTAGAILSIAFDRREPILEANTIRLFSRLVGYRGVTSSREGQDVLWSFAREILPQSKVGDFNQATMELGSKICTPREPKCHECPVAVLCRANAHGWQSKIPATTKKLAYEDAHETCVVVRKRGRVLLRRCGDSERWAGLWDFPRFPVPREPGRSVDAQVAENLEQITGAKIILGDRLTTIKHGVTRFRITLDCYDATWQSGSTSRDSTRWLAPSQLSEYPLTMTARKIARLIT